jgi:hypothetical protein
VNVPLGAVTDLITFMQNKDPKLIGIQRIISIVNICIKTHMANTDFWSVKSAIMHSIGSATNLRTNPMLLSWPICETESPCSK